MSVEKEGLGRRETSSEDRAQRMNDRNEELRSEKAASTAMSDEPAARPPTHSRVNNRRAPL